MLFLISFLILILVLSFLSSLAEGVFLSITPPYVLALEKKGRREGTLLRHLKHNAGKPLAAILSLNTIANSVGSAVIGGEVVLRYGSTYLGVTSAVLTVLILVFSEIIPKTIGTLYWRRLATPVTYGLTYLIVVLYPFVILAILITQKLSKNKPLRSFTREEFEAFAELGAKEGQLKTQESRIVANLFRLSTSTLEDVLTPRTVIFSVPEHMTVGVFCAQHSDVSFSRIPVYQKHREDITGFVLLSDILLAEIRDQHHIPLSEFKRELKAVPSSLLLSQLFDFLLHSKEHMVLVVDEYGGVEGIATMEDLIETLLGFEIVDESETVPDLQALARKRGKLRAKHLGISPGKKGENEEDK
ncbi:MAG: HlyC/CorC family transporter [Gammaproteobacteria bacterium]|nr:HlyC/CorC family transporter [Gammaproteobacteria bacterium]